MEILNITFILFILIDFSMAYVGLYRISFLSIFFNYLFSNFLHLTCNNFKAPPKITTSFVIGGKSVHLAWTLSQSDGAVKRYRILVSRDDWKTSFEWPSNNINHSKAIFK